MNYEEALQEWGKIRLREYYQHRPGPNFETQGKVKVRFEFNEGYACCGGTDPYCYCSFAESPSADVVISCGQYYMKIDTNSFDFATVLKEIIEAGNGTVTLGEADDN